MLKLNDDKTEIIHLSSRFRSSMPLEFVNVGQSNIVPASYARNIGVTIDKHLTLLRHLTGMCQKASLALRNIGRIRRYLDQNCTEKLVHAYVTSRLDYCNSLLSGLPSASLAKLQRLQNAAARLVTLSKKHEHHSRNPYYRNGRYGSPAGWRKLRRFANIALVTPILYSVLLFRL